MVTQARSLFPNGLFQPPGSFRFSADALALANLGAHIAQHNTDPTTEGVFVDLGTGCGVVGLALLLHLAAQPAGAIWRGVGVDWNAELVNAANDNATLLDLTTVFYAVQTDLNDLAALPPAQWPVSLSPHSADLVLFNPPWRLEGTGLLPPSTLRRKALFGTATTLHLFARVAAHLLKPTGRVCSVMSTARKKDQRAALLAAGLHSIHECPVITKAGAPPPFVLFEAGNT